VRVEIVDNHDHDHDDLVYHKRIDCHEKITPHEVEAVEVDDEL